MIGFFDTGRDHCRVNFVPMEGGWFHQSEGWELCDGVLTKVFKIALYQRTRGSAWSNTSGPGDLTNSSEVSAKLPGSMAFFDGSSGEFGATWF